MNKSKEHNIDEYMTLTDSSNNLENKSDLSNIPTSITEKNEKSFDVLKTIVDYNLEISKMFSDEVLKTQRIISSMIEPLTHFSKKIIELYDPIIKNISINLTNIFENVDWSQFDLIYKEIALKCLSNGFYPYHNTKIDYVELVDTNSKNKQLKIINEGIKLDIGCHKKDLILTYPQYKKYINEIYKLYKEHNYRLCILSLINLISIINNEQFEYIDFTEKYKVRKKLLEKQIMKDKETNYLLFAQYIRDDDLVNANELLKDYRETPKEYLKVPYNRNAIAHGYSKKFGNEINCLRWFSVLFNTLEISKKIIEFKNEISNQ